MKIKQLEAIYRTTKEDTFSVSSPEEVKNFCTKLLNDKPSEWFIVLNTNSKNNVMSYSVVSIGTVCESIVHAREVFRNAILSNSVAIILCHNHPSGTTDPSLDDIATTNKLIEAGKIIGIPILDHVIIAENKIFSFKEKGLII